MALFVAASVVSTSSNAFACLCSAVSVKRRVKRMKTDAAAIFIGRVKTISIESEPLTQPQIFRVVLTTSKSWKPGEHVEYTIYTGGGCGVNFRENEEYLVYAEVDKLGHLITDMCMGTRSLKLARKDLKYLGKPISRSQGKTENKSVRNKPVSRLRRRSGHGEDRVRAAFLQFTASTTIIPAW
jgi:hypothetical protein